MGRDKALLKIKDKTFIEKIMDEFDDFDEKIIARGHNSMIDSYSWVMVPDIYQNCGPIGGLHSVLSSCKSDALFTMTCDMPFVKRELADYLIRYILLEYDAVIVRESNGRIHPLCGIYKKSVSKIAEEQILSGNYRMMSLLDRIRVQYVTIDCNEKQLLNINTLEDYEKIK